MKPFISYRDMVDNQLQYFILQREFPHYVGRISVAPVERTLAQSAIAGYNLWVVFFGTLRGNMIPGYQNVAEEIQSAIDQMALWFLSERIKSDEKRYKKFKIIPHVASSPK